MTLADKLKAKIHELTDQYLEADVRWLRSRSANDAQESAAAVAELDALDGILANLKSAYAVEVAGSVGVMRMNIAISSAHRHNNEEEAIRLQSILDGFGETEKPQ